MTTVADILHFVETLAPRSMKMEWDNVGLNCGRMDRPVTKILVTHHALIWKPGFITDQNVQGRNTLFLIENSIAHINAHTNLDQAPGGVNDVLARTLGLQNIEIVNPVGEPAFGLLRCGDVAEQSLADFLSHVKTALSCDGLRYADGGKPVRRVCVGGGACGSELMDAYRAGCDTFVTSDVKYNQFWDAQDLGLNLIDAGHFHTENPVVAVLAEKIAYRFPEIQVKISETHWDCAKYY